MHITSSPTTLRVRVNSYWISWDRIRAGIAMCILKSRCSSIKCCCISCERSVLSEQAITEQAHSSAV